MDTHGNISIWKNNSDNPKAPQYRGVVQDDERNVIFEISLWKNVSDNPKAPMITGKLKPPYKKDEAYSSGTDDF